MLCGGRVLVGHGSWGIANAFPLFSCPIEPITVEYQNHLPINWRCSKHALRLISLIFSLTNFAEYLWLEYPQLITSVNEVLLGFVAYDARKVICCALWLWGRRAVSTVMSLISLFCVGFESGILSISHLYQKSRQSRILDSQIETFNNKS